MLKTNKALRDEVYSRRVSITDLAAEMGMHRTTLSTMLNSRVKPSAEWVAEVLAACDAVKKKSA